MSLMYNLFVLDSMLLHTKPYQQGIDGVETCRLEMFVLIPNVSPLLGRRCGSIMFPQGFCHAFGLMVVMEV